MLIVGSKHRATVPYLRLSWNLRFWEFNGVVCYRIGSSFELPYLVGSTAVVFFKEGEGLNDSSLSCGSCSFSGGGYF